MGRGVNQSENENIAKEISRFLWEFASEENKPTSRRQRELGISDGWSAAKDDASLGNFPANVSGLQVLRRSEVPVAVALPPPFAK